MDVSQFPDRLLKDYEAAAMLGRSRSKFRADVKAGKLPPPVYDGNMSRWPQSELLPVIEQLKALRDAKAAA